MLKNNDGSAQLLTSLVTILGITAFFLFTGKFIAEIPYVPLVLAFSALIFLAAFINTSQSMILLIFAMLLSPEFTLGAVSNRQNIMIRLDDLFIVVFMLAWLARSALLKKHRFIAKLPINRFVFFYSCAFIFATAKGMIVGNIVPLKGFFYVFKYIEYFMVLYLAAGVLKSKEQIRSYVKAFLIVLVIVNIYAFTQIGQDRVSAPFEGTGEPNTLGGYQVLMLGIVIGLLTHYRPMLWKWMMAGIFVLTLVPFSYTESRASYAAMVVMYLSLVFFSKRNVKPLLIGALIIATILAIFFTPPVIKNRIMYTFIPQQDDTVVNVKIGEVTLDPSASARINDWVRLFELWKQKPLMGHGVTGGGFVDGQFISVLVESGLFGLMSFVLLLWMICRHAYRVYKTTQDDFYQGIAVGFLASTLGMAVHAITANTFIIIRIMEPFWFFAAIVLMIPTIEKATAAKEEQQHSPKQHSEGYVRNTQFLLKNGKLT